MKNIATFIGMTVLMPNVAGAATASYSFSVVDLTASTSYSFDLAASPMPSTYASNNDFSVGGHTFLSTIEDGGFDSFSGQQLYTGPESAPTFTLGTYSFLADRHQGTHNGTLTIAELKPIIYHFSVVDTSHPSAYSFDLPASPTPTTYAVNDSFSVGGHTFFNALVKGGFDRFTGDQLYTGSESAPTYKLGSYIFQRDNSLGSDNGSLTISLLTAAVPEPACWALMIAGFGMTGFAMRNRKVTFAA